jgi:HAD superfamily hydrolase (TIGR01549 family)
MVRAVLFDLDDTLFDHRRSAAEALRHVQAVHDEFRRMPFDEFERLHSLLLEELHPEVVNARLEMDEARRERFRRLFEQCGTVASEDLCAATARTYRTEYLNARCAVAGAASLVAAVRRHAKVGIVSNNVLQEQREKLEFCKLSAYVDVLVVSEEAGVSKPDPAIFRMAVEGLGVTAGETVMLGDSWAADVIGARRAGIRAVWFNPMRMPSPEPGLAVPELHTLEPASAALVHLLGS